MRFSKPLGKLELELLGEKVIQKRKAGGQKGEIMVGEVVR